MPLMKFWDAGYLDEATGMLGGWFPIAGMNVSQAVLSIHGGTMRGPLTVNGALTSDGGIHAKHYTGSPQSLGLNANLKLRGRTVDFGGNEVVAVGAPTAPDDGSTLAAMTAASNASLKRFTLTPGAGWTVYGGDHGPFHARMDGSGMVTLQGLLKTTQSISPGGTSLPICTLPVELRPQERRLFVCAGASIGVLHRVDIEATGVIRYQAGPAMGTGHWLSMSDICYFPANV